MAGKGTKFVRAAYDYTAQDAGELSFAEGDIIVVTAQHESGWWTGTIQGKKSSGTFPSNFTEPHTPKPATPQRPKPAAGGGADPMSELAAKLARRKANDGSSNAATPSPSSSAPIPSPRGSNVPRPGGPNRAPQVNRMAQTLAPTSNRPNQKNTSSVANARASIVSQGLPGMFGGAPLKKTAPPENKKVPTAEPLFGRPAKPTANTRSVNEKKPIPDRGVAAPSGNIPRPLKPVGGPRNIPTGAGPRKVPPPTPGPRTPAPATPSPRATPPTTPGPRTPTPGIPAPLAPVPAVPEASDEPIIVRATCDYAGTGGENELIFEKGAEIVIKQKDDSGWWEGSLGDASGWFPQDFVEEIVIEKGPTLAEKIASSASSTKRLESPKKVVRKGRRPPTRGRKAGTAVKSMKTETNDPVFATPTETTSKVRKSTFGGSGNQIRLPPIGGGGPTKANAVGSGLRRTVAPGAFGKPSQAKETEQMDFRANLRSSVAPGALKGIKKKDIPPPSKPEPEQKTSPFGPRVGGRTNSPSPSSTPTPAAEPEKTSPFSAFAGKKQPKPATKPEPAAPEPSSSPFGARVGSNKPKAAAKPEPAAPEPSSSPFGARVGSNKPKAATKLEPAASEPSSSPFGTKVGGNKAKASPRGNVPSPNTVPGKARGPGPGCAAAAKKGSATAQLASSLVSIPTVLGSYESFTSFIEDKMKELRTARINGAASCKPQLNRSNPDDFVFAMCSIDGVQYSSGEYSTSFSLQEAAFPFLYAIAQSEVPSLVDGLVALQKSSSEHPMKLHRSKAQNPLCKAGAIALCSALYQDEDLMDRSHQLGTQLSALAGHGLGCDVANILASKRFSFDDKALAYWMQQQVPLTGNPDDTLDLLFQVQATFTSCQQLADMAATLANGGVCPLSNQQVISGDAVDKTMQMLKDENISSFALPGYGGESGALFISIPGVGGFAAYNPLLGSSGLSQRSSQLLSAIVSTYSL